MGKLYKRGKTYYGDYEDKRGKRHRVSLKTQDRLVAKAQLRKLELTETDPASHATQTLAESLDYLTAVAMPAAGRAAGTIQCYSQKARHLVRFFGVDAQLGDITRDEVQRFIGLRLSEGAAHGTVHKELVTLRQALTESQQRGLSSVDPASVIPKFSAQYKPRDRHLSADELERLIGELQPHRKLWAMIAAFAGLRSSEVEGLRWEDVDFGRGWIRVRGTKTKGSFRRVPILAQLKPWLETFDAGEGLVVDPWGNCRRDLQTACKRAGIDRCSPNDLRRTFTSWMKQAGIDSLTVAQMLGHTSTRMVELVYGRLTERTYQDAAEKCAVYVTNSCSNMVFSGTPDTAGDNAKTPESSKNPGVRVVPRDRVELPTRGFSVPDLQVLSGGKDKRKRGSGQ